MVQHFADMYADKGVDEAIERAAEYQRAARSMRVGPRLAVAGSDSLAAAAWKRRSGCGSGRHGSVPAAAACVRALRCRGQGPGAARP